MGVIKNSDPQAMYNMAKEVLRYADGLEKDMQKLYGKHTGISGSWSGKQYDDFTAILEAAKKSIGEQITELRSVADEVKADADALAAAQGIAIKK